jgi:hypothetical protein
MAETEPKQETTADAVVVKEQSLDDALGYARMMVEAASCYPVMGTEAGRAVLARLGIRLVNWYAVSFNEDEMNARAAELMVPRDGFATDDRGSSPGSSGSSAGAGVSE